MDSSTKNTIRQRSSSRRYPTDMMNILTNYHLAITKLPSTEQLLQVIPEDLRPTKQSIVSRANTVKKREAKDK